MDRLKCSWTVISSVLILCLYDLQLCFGEGRSFLGDGSYLLSEPFTSDSLLLRFTFQTSELNGLLLSSSASGTEFSVELRGGSVFIEDNFKDNHTLGSFLNDDDPHTLTIYHDAASRRFTYRLDSMPDVLNTYAADRRPIFGARGFYLGGPSIAARYPPFVGCLRNILYGSDGNGQSLSTSVSSDDLQAVAVSLSANGTFGDCDQCSGVNCGSGRCAVRWLLNATFCDCRNSAMLGASCSEDVDDFITEFPTPDDSYLCYTPTYTPNLKVSGIDPSNTFTVQLLPPIPSEGTILTAYTRKGYFSLRIENSRLIYKYNNQSTLIRRNLNDVFPPVSLLISNRSQAYQIDVTVRSQVTELSLKMLSNSTVVSGNSVTNGMLQGLIYSTVCVGGSLLEVSNYEGRMRRALFNYHSLFEERNACRLKSRRQSFSDFISFASSPLAPSFALETVTLKASRMSFQIRTELTGASIFWLQSGMSTLFLSTVTRLTVVTLTVDGNHEFGTLQIVNDNEWHQVDVQTSFSGTGADNISIVIDGSTVKSFNAVVNLTELVDSPLHFGSPGGTTGQGFQGCMRNFVFQETPTSEALRLNLDLLPHVDSEAYAIDRSCFSCRGAGLSCPMGQECSDPGYNQTERCVDSAVSKSAIGLNCTEPPTLPPPPTAPTTFVTLWPPFTSSPSSPTPPDASTSEPPSTSPTPPPPPPSTTAPLTQTTPTQRGAAVIGPEAAAGIGIGVAVSLVAVASLIVCCVICRMRASGQGFYRTNETSDHDVSLGHFNTSLGQHSATPVATNHSHDDWSIKNGGGHSNGGPPPYTTSQSNSKPLSSRDKEYYL